MQQRKLREQQLTLEILHVTGLGEQNKIGNPISEIPRVLWRGIYRAKRDLSASEVARSVTTAVVLSYQRFWNTLNERKCKAYIEIFLAIYLGVLVFLCTFAPKHQEQCPKEQLANRALA